MEASILCHTYFGTQITYIINNSISSGEFPLSWKCSKVTPVFKKKGEVTDVKIYRPVSNLKSASKIIELIVNKQVLNYLETNKLLPNSQFGFRARRSTFTAMCSMHEKWLENKEKKLHQAASFLDLSSAFDTLSKDIFCQKLKALGFNEKSVKWFDSYLSSRSQCVMIGSTISEPIKLEVGSPQGAILSPTIFLILVSDVDLWCKEAVLCQYADDTSCTVVDKNMNALKSKCEERVEELFTFMAVNKLSANHDKTNILVMKHGKDDTEVSFQIGESQIEESSKEKSLGIIVNNKLDWSDHIAKLEKELRYRLFTLRRMEQVVPKSLMKKVADGIFCSVLRYGLGIFCPVRIEETESNSTSIEGIKVIFHDVLRLLCSSKRSDHTSIESMLKKLNWLSVNQLAAEIRLMEVWKAPNLENYCLSDLFQEVDNERVTRSSGTRKLKTNFKSNLRESSFHYQSVRLWNSAPLEIIQAETESKAKSEIRKYVLTLPI